MKKLFFAVCLVLSGCATPASFTGLCGMLPIGQTDEGIPVVKVHCEADK